MSLPTTWGGGGHLTPDSRLATRVLSAARDCVSNFSPLRARAHPCGAYNSVGDCLPPLNPMSLPTTWGGGGHLTLDYTICSSHIEWFSQNIVIKGSLTRTAFYFFFPASFFGKFPLFCSGTPRLPGKFRYQRQDRSGPSVRYWRWYNICG